MKIKKLTWKKPKYNNVGHALLPCPVCHQQLALLCLGHQPLEGSAIQSAQSSIQPECGLEFQLHGQDGTGNPCSAQRWDYRAEPEMTCGVLSLFHGISAAPQRGCGGKQFPHLEVCCAIGKCKFLFNGKGKSSWFPACRPPLQPKRLSLLCFAHLAIPNHKENVWWEQVKNNHWSFVAGMFIVFFFF